VKQSEDAYVAVPVTYDSPVAAGVKLAGALTCPKTCGPFPAAVLIAGSGRLDRDETVAGHAIFAVVADYLTRRGVAVLRFDKRGISRSTGDYTLATTKEFADDVLAGVEFLKSRAEVSPTRIGLVGHTEGAILGPLVATRSTDVAFVVALGGPS